MRTVRKVFYDAIVDGNWEDICSVYTAITGEEAPTKTIVTSCNTVDDILNQSMQVAAVISSERPMTENVTMVGPISDTIFGDNEEENLIQEPLVEPLVIPVPVADMTDMTDMTDSLPQADDSPQTDEFYIEHGKQNSVNKDGKSRCSKKPMVIPEKRKNLFHDNGKAYSNEKVSVSPALGVQEISPRGERANAKKVQVTCKICGITEEVSVLLSSGYRKNPEENTYKCNACNSPTARAKELRQQRN